MFFIQTYLLQLVKYAAVFFVSLKKFCHFFRHSNRSLLTGKAMLSSKEKILQQPLQSETQMFLSALVRHTLIFVSSSC